MGKNNNEKLFQLYEKNIFHNKIKDNGVRSQMQEDWIYVPKM